MRKPKRGHQQSYGGCVIQQVFPPTEALLSIYQGEQAGVDTSAGLWQTVCEKHHSMRAHTTLRLAFEHLSYPSWCEACLKELAEKP